MPKDLKYDSTRIFQKFCSVFELWAQSLGSRRMITITRTLVLPIKHFQAAGITTRTLVLPIEYFQAAGITTRTLVLPIEHFQAADITTRTLVLPIEHFQAAGSNSVLQLHESVVWDLVVRVKDRTPLLRHISAHRRPAPSFTCVYCCTMMTTFSHRQHATSHKWLHSATNSMPQATNDYIPLPTACHKPQTTPGSSLPSKPGTHLPKADI